MSDQQPSAAVVPHEDLSFFVVTVIKRIFEIPGNTSIVGNHFDDTAATRRHHLPLDHLHSAPRRGLEF